MSASLVPKSCCISHETNFLPSVRLQNKHVNWNERILSTLYDSWYEVINFSKSTNISQHVIPITNLNSALPPISQTSIRHFPLFSTTRSYNEKYLFDFLPEDHVIPIRTIGSNLLFQPARDRHQKPAIRHLKILQLNNRVRMMKTK